MTLKNLLLSSLLLGAALSSPGVSRRQDGPVDPGTAADCTYYDTALDSSYTCAWFEFNWGLSHEDFVSYVRLSPPCITPRNDDSIISTH
jgi:hypothetical protein